MSGGKKRSRWDDDGNDEGAPIPKTSSSAKVVKKEEGVIPSASRVRGDIAPEASSTSLSQPFKWGEKIKIEGEEKAIGLMKSSSKDGHGVLGDGEGKVNEKLEEKKKANFGLTGALAKDEKTGNLRNGIVLKYSESLDAAVPPHVWRLYVFEGEELVETLYIHRQPSYLIGKDRRVADIILCHASCSKQHAVIAFRNVEIADQDFGSKKRINKPYLLDLKSTNKTYLNGKEIDDSRYYELREKDCIRFGVGQTEYVLLHDRSQAVDAAE